jgi:competence protein ComEC
MKRPIYPLLICYALGLIIADYFPFLQLSLYLPWVLLLWTLISGGFLYTRRYRSATVTLLLAFTVLGISRYTFSQKLPAHHLLHGVQNNERVTLEGRLYQPREKLPDRDRLYLKTEILEKGTSRQTVTGKIRITIYKVSTFHDIPDLQYGDRLRVRVRLRVPTNYQNPWAFDYKAYLARRGIYLTGSLSHYSPYLLRRLETGSKFSLLRRIFHVREQMMDFLNPSLEIPSETRPLRENIEEPFEPEAGEDPDSLGEEKSRSEDERGILQAMILGSKTSLTPELQENFRLSGLYHLLVVSGGNIGILAGFLFIVFKFFKILSRPLLLGVIGSVFLYAFLAGFEPPMIRASIMTSIFLLATLFDRDAEPFYSLATSAMLLLFLDPFSLFEASFQLTMTATLAILYAYQLVSFKKESVWKKVQAFFLGILLSTTFAEVSTAPLIIYYFNHLYPYGLLANIPALPLSGVILPLGILACGMNFFIPPLAQFLLQLDLILVRGFIDLSAFIARLPYSELPVSTRFLIPLLLSYLLVFGILKGFKRPLGQRIIFASGAILLIFTVYALTFWIIPTPLRVTFLDVGQGDSSVIEFPKGSTLLVDGGGSSYRSRFDVGRNILAPYLWHQGISRVEALIISHAHIDHFQGFRYLIEKFDVGALWISPRESRNPFYEELLQAAVAKGIPLIKVQRGYRQRFGEVEVRILHPSSIYLLKTSPTSHRLTNNYSLVVKLTYGKICFLFPGDIEREAEEFLLQNGDLEPCTILKVPHHGSATSSSPGFLEALQPSIGVISTGKYSRFESFSPLILERYRKAGIKIYRTDQDGAIQIQTDGMEVQVKTFGQR